MISKLPNNVAEKIRQAVEKDLAPGSLMVNVKLLLAVMIGGLMSLSICGQFGMGVTGWAEALSHRIHETMSPLVCASICGTLFAVFPTLLLRLVLCSPLQFKVILKQKFMTLSVWYFGAGMALATYGKHGQGAWEILFWSVSAVLTSYVLAGLLRAFFPMWNLGGHRPRSLF
jgi:hypothetical protein